MKNPEQYSAAEMERMMKVQEVILKAMAKKITWWAGGRDHRGHATGRCGGGGSGWRRTATTGWSTGARESRALQRVPLATVEKVLRLYQEKYYDLNMRHFHEKLAGGARDRVELHVGEEGAARSGAGGASGASGASTGGGGRGGRCRACCCTSTAASTDGSEDGRWHDLIVILDDATSEIYYAQLVEEESTRTVMAGLREVIERRDCSARCTAIGAAIFSSRRRRAGRWISTD